MIRQFFYNCLVKNIKYGSKYRRSLRKVHPTFNLNLNLNNLIYFKIWRELIMKKTFITLFGIIVLLFGCSSNEAEVDTNRDPVDVEALEVKVHVLTPNKVDVNEVTELSAHVTQNKENVNDAEAVEFEIWESGYRDEGKIIEGKLEKDGVYSAEFTFEHEGVYYLYAHTTARGSHVMPKQQIIVGNPNMSQVKEDQSTDSMEHMEGSTSTEDNEHKH